MRFYLNLPSSSPLRHILLIHHSSVFPSIFHFPLDYLLYVKPTFHFLYLTCALINPYNMTVAFTLSSFSTLSTQWWLLVFFFTMTVLVSLGQASITSNF